MTTLCAQCNTEPVDLGNGCPLHGDVCDDCRPHGCADCADNGDWDADAYYETRYP